jgi:hypothetical protein
MLHYLISNSIKTPKVKDGGVVISLISIRETCSVLVRFCGHALQRVPGISRRIILVKELLEPDEQVSDRFYRTDFFLGVVGGAVLQFDELGQNLEKIGDTH